MSGVIVLDAETYRAVRETLTDVREANDPFVELALQTQAGQVLTLLDAAEARSVGAWETLEGATLVLKAHEAMTTLAGGDVHNPLAIHYRNFAALYAPAIAAALVHLVATVSTSPEPR